MLLAEPCSENNAVKASVPTVLAPTSSLGQSPLSEGMFEEELRNLIDRTAAKVSTGNEAVMLKGPATLSDAGYEVEQQTILKVTAQRLIDDRVLKYQRQS